MAPGPKSRTAAILTGDLIGSTEVPVIALEHAMEALAEASRGIAAWTRWSGADARFTRFRGDGWQTHIGDPGFAVRAALTLIAALRAADTGLATRVAIGIGRIDSVGTDSLADAHGPAFEVSGRALDHMPRTRRLTIDGQGIAVLHRIVVELLDDRTTRMSKEQAEALALYLHPDNPTLTDVAPRLGISPQAVNYRLAGVGGTAIRHALRDWEADFAARAMTAGNAA